MRVEHFKTGTTLKIIGLRKSNALYRKRLIAMGLIPGTLMTLTRIAPLGDPIELDVRGYLLSLRKQEADILMVEEV